MKLKRIAAECLAAMMVLAGTAVAQQTDNAQERPEQRAAMASGAGLRVESERGSVTVEGWEKPELWLEVHKYYEGDGDRDRWMRETQVRLSGDEQHRSVKVEMPNMTCFTYCDRRYGVDLKLHVPKQLQLELRSDRAELRVSSTEGSIRIDNDRGPVEIESFSGSIRIHSDRSPVHVRDARIQNGIEVITDRGDV